MSISDQMNTRISIIVPAYNEEGVICDCLKSLVIQDYPSNKYEIIVVDDGSTDNTAGLVKSFAKKCPSITLVSKENGGKGSSQNLGLRHAEGNIILVTDADVIVPSNWIRLMVKELSETDFVVGGYHVYLDSNSGKLEKMQNAEYLIKFRYGGFKGVPRTGGNLGFHKDIISHLGYFNENIKSVTPEFIQRALLMGYNIKFAPDIMVQTWGISNFTGFIKQKLRWREGILSILKLKAKPSISDIMGIGYTHGLSLALLALTVLSLILFDYRYFLSAFISIFFIDLIFYIKPLYRMCIRKTDRYYIPYFILQLLLIMLVRLVLIPHLLVCLMKGTNATFEAQRD